MPDLVDPVQINSGAYGTLFKAFSKQDGENVTVKVVPTENSGVEFTALERLREYQSTGRLNSRKHGSLMGVRNAQYDEQNGQAVFVLDHYPGETLLSFIARHPEGVSEDQARPMIEGMLDCVELVHQTRMVHLDLKAEHFIIGDQPGLVLVDFGAAFLFSETASPPRADVVPMRRSHYGTLTYSAPETFQDQCCLGSDMWSVGVLTYALLMGDSPWLQDGSQARFIQTANFDRSNTRWEQLSLHGRQFVEALLRVDPDTRMSLSACRRHTFLREK